MKSRVQARDRIARYLGVLVAGEALSAEDAELIEQAMDSVAANLAGRGVYTLSDLDNIPDEAFEAFCRCVVMIACADFSTPPEKLTGFEGEPYRSESALRELRVDALSDDPVRFSEY